MVAGIAARNAVVAVGIYKLLEVLVGLHQCLDVFRRVLIVDIVVGKAVAYQKRAMELRGTGYGVDLVVA